MWHRFLNMLRKTWFMQFLGRWVGQWLVRQGVAVEVSGTFIEIPRDPATRVYVRTTPKPSKLTVRDLAEAEIKAVVTRDLVIELSPPVSMGQAGRFLDQPEFAADRWPDIQVTRRALAG